MRAGLRGYVQFNKYTHKHKDVYACRERLERLLCPELVDLKRVERRKTQSELVDICPDLGLWTRDEFDGQNFGISRSPPPSKRNSEICSLWGG